MDEKDIITQTVQSMINFITINWDNIPDKFKYKLGTFFDDNNNTFIRGLTSKEDHIVVLLIDRQKPSREQSHDFDEERLGINRKGQLIWGFDSGCSCPTPWSDTYPDCYEPATRKVLEIKWEQFDQTELLQTMNKVIQDIKNAINEMHLK